MEKHSMGVYVIKKEEAEEGDDPADVGVFVEGVILMENLRSPARACAAMLGVIYAINLAYPKELRRWLSQELWGTETKLLDMTELLCYLEKNVGKRSLICPTLIIF
uniref:Uncharacterized protein n=1 Tax=Oryzias latipes TaxID=8090 RepID=A0A3P9GY60_ORYLA